MSDAAIELVCFDIGGVMLRITSTWQDAARRAGGGHELDAAGLFIDPQFLEVTYSLEKGQIEPSDYANRVAALAEITPDDVMTILDAWLIDPYPGLDDLLDKLDQTEVQTACLSNTNHAHWETVTSPGSRYLPLERLHHRFASPFVGHRKPEPAIYEHVERETNIRPAGILFFDDHPDNCRAATNRGWNVHQIDPEDDPIAQVTGHLKRYGVLSL